MGLPYCNTLVECALTRIFISGFVFRCSLFMLRCYCSLCCSLLSVFCKTINHSPQSGSACNLCLFGVYFTHHLFVLCVLCFMPVPSSVDEGIRFLSDRPSDMHPVILLTLCLEMYYTDFCQIYASDALWKTLNFGVKGQSSRSWWNNIND